MKRSPQILVTNHALIRHLERIAGIDMERLRRGIRRKVRHAVNSGATSVTVDGFTYRLDGMRVVTIIPADDSHEPGAAFDAMAKGRSVRRTAK